MKDWSCVKLSDICTITMGQSPKSSFYNNNEEGIPFLQGNRTFGIKYPLIDTYTTKITKIAKKDDIIMSVRAPVGDINIAPTELCLGRGLCGFKSKNKNQFFLYYLLVHNINKLKQRESGTVFGSVNKKDIESLIVNCPEKESTQKKIAFILSSLDDKIELNNKINKNLEEMAQAIFKSWFVDFEPWGGEMPDDWEYTILDNIISKFTSGLNPRKNFKLGKGQNYYVTIKNMSNNNIILDNRCDKIDNDALSLINKRSQLDEGDILFSAIGTIGRVFYLDKINSNWNISESIFSLRAKDKKQNSFLYQMLLNNNLQNYVKSLATGSAQRGIRKKDFIKYTFAYNEKQAIKYSNLYGNPILKQIKINTNENATLLQIRDTLLPKLLSGELDVSNLDI